MYQFENDTLPNRDVYMPAGRGSYQLAIISRGTARTSAGQLNRRHIGLFLLLHPTGSLRSQTGRVFKSELFLDPRFVGINRGDPETKPRADLASR